MPHKNAIKRAARGRGNQGDWAKPIHTDKYGTAPEHVDHNKEVELKRQLKLAKRKSK